MDDHQKALSRLAQGDINGLEILVEHHQVQAVYAAYMIVYMGNKLTKDDLIAIAESLR
jgi:hypothetical protein